MHANQTTFILRLLLILASIILPPPLRAQVGHEWQRLPDVPFDPEPYSPPICYRDQTIYFVSGTTQTLAWSTHDGRRWQCTETGLPARFSVPFVFQDRLWLPAGALSAAAGTSVTQGALYSCTEPAHWTQESLVPETNTLSLVFPVGSTLVLYANENVYTSADGKAWIYQSAGASVRNIPYVFAGRLWDCVAGKISSSTNWLIDYDHFTNTPSSLTYEGQEFTMPVPCGDRLLLLQADYQGQPGGTWESRDGTQWTQVNAAPPFAPITSYQGAYGNGGLWELGDYCFAPTTVNLLDRGLWFSPEATPQLKWEPGFCSFGDVMLSAPPPVQSVQLYNSTQQIVHFGSADFIGADTTRFGFAQPPDLSPLPAHTTRTLQLQFDPVAVGYQWATLQLTTDLTSETTRTFTLAGNGIVDAPLARVEPVALDFGSRLPDTGPSEPKYLTLRNDGTVTLTLSKYSFSSGYPADFTLQSTDTTPLAPFSSRTVVVQFKPTQHYGLRRTTLHLSYSDYGGDSVELTGRSGPPAHWQGLDWQYQAGDPLKLIGDVLVSVVPYNHEYYAVMEGLVYRTIDFKQWTQVANSSPFMGTEPLKYLHPSLTVFQNKIWAFDRGGWSSDDGVNWTTLTLPTAMTTIKWPQVACFNQQLWLLGGYHKDDWVNEVWSSTDGIHWVGPMEGPMPEYVYDASVGVVGGIMIWAAEKQAWSTVDGLHWMRLHFFDNLLTWGPSMTLHQNYLWVTVGGHAFWRSADGLTWEWVADNTTIPYRDWATLASDGQSLFFFGGSTFLHFASRKDEGYTTGFWVSAPSANAVGAWACYQ
jgi:hypothetical protein